MVKNSFTMFACTPNSSGQLILDASPNVVCSSSDPVYAALFPFAVLSFVGYGIGIPGLFFYILFRYRTQIRGDQSLREVGLGFHPSGNPYFRTRQRFQKLYVDFKVRGPLGLCLVYHHPHAWDGAVPGRADVVTRAPIAERFLGLS